MNNKVTNHPKHYFLNRMTRTSTARTALGEFSMYTPKHIAEAMAELFDDPKWEGVWARQPLALLFHSEQEPLFHQLHQRFFRKARLPRDSIPQIAPSNGCRAQTPLPFWT